MTLGVLLLPHALDLRAEKKAEMEHHQALQHHRLKLIPEYLTIE
jgi:hypothetical protein